MSENYAAKRLVDLIPAIMQRWDDRVRAEVSPAAGSTEIVLRDRPLVVRTAPEAASAWA